MSRQYGDDDLNRMSIDGFHSHKCGPSEPALMQTSDMFVMLGNPIGGGSDPLTCPPGYKLNIRDGSCSQVGGIFTPGGSPPDTSMQTQYFPNNNPGGNILVDAQGNSVSQGNVGYNPNVSSGGGSIPQQSFFVNGGVQDANTNWNETINALANPAGITGNADPAISSLADNQFGMPLFSDCNCSNPDNNQRASSLADVVNASGGSVSTDSQNVDAFGNPIGGSAAGSSFGGYYSGDSDYTAGQIYRPVGSYTDASANLPGMGTINSGGVPMQAF